MSKVKFRKTFICPLSEKHEHRQSVLKAIAHLQTYTTSCQDLRFAEHSLNPPLDIVVTLVKSSSYEHNFEQKPNGHPNDSNFFYTENLLIVLTLDLDCHLYHHFVLADSHV